MDIREATPEDGAELQQLQARCPQGTSLLVCVVNTPDFFARVKPYEWGATFVACEGERIAGSAACATRDARVGASVRRVGYEFQYFTDPARRRTGIARQLRRRIEAELRGRGAALSYCWILDGNRASLRLFEQEGFRRHRTVVMSALCLTRELNVPPRGRIRPLRADDLPAAADLLNATWRGRELHEPRTAASLAAFLERAPGLKLDQVAALETDGGIAACLGYWDWSQVMRITVLSLTWRLRLLGRLLTLFRILPRFMRPGDVLRQWMFLLVGFRDVADLAALVRHWSNEALRRGVEHVFLVHDRADPVRPALKGLIHVDTALHLYVKPLQPGVGVTDGPVFVNGIDL